MACSSKASPTIKSERPLLSIFLMKALTSKTSPYIRCSPTGGVNAGASENCKKSSKIDVGARSERVPACDMILVAILKRFLQILDGFWKGSGGILEELWRDSK